MRRSTTEEAARRMTKEEERIRGRIVAKDRKRTFTGRKMLPRDRAGREFQKGWASVNRDFAFR